VKGRRGWDNRSDVGWGGRGARDEKKAFGGRGGGWCERKGTRRGVGRRWGGVEEKQRAGGNRRKTLGTRNYETAKTEFLRSVQRLREVNWARVVRLTPEPKIVRKQEGEAKR